MTNKKTIIKEEKIVYSDYLKIIKADISHHFKNEKIIEYTRESVLVSDAVAVFIYNKDEDKVVLTKQFRYSISKRTDENIVEIVAGKVDKDESISQATIRETLEEVGYKIKKENLFYLFKVFSAPGFSNGRVYHTCAVVENKDKINKGGGVEQEGEEIEVIEISFSDFINKMKNNEIVDAKTLLNAYASIPLLKRKNYLNQNKWKILKNQ